VILGKAVTTEFASTEPHGTLNPRDTKRTPGGSSSGSAAAVAAAWSRRRSGRKWLLDPAPGELLRVRRLQTERRPHQPRREL
jgi:hypothetical protein